MKEVKLFTFSDHRNRQLVWRDTDMPAKWRSLKLHALAERFPEMGDLEYQALKEDIREAGLKEPILLYQGKILDGRHRHRACKELDDAGELPSKPETATFRGSREEALQRVTSGNLMRRHLSKSQRAMFLVDAGLVAPPADAGKRRKYGTGRNQITAVGKRYGVSHVTLYKAAYIHAEDKRLAQQVLEGDLSVAKAEAQLNKRAVKANAEITDAAGRKVPERLKPIFAVRQQFGSIEGHLQSAEKLLAGISKGGLPAAELKEAQTSLATARSTLRRVKPHLTCAECRGEGCTACSRRGWLPQTD